MKLKVMNKVFLINKFGEQIVTLRNKCYECCESSLLQGDLYPYLIAISVTKDYFD